jgi:hypothetical protein
LPNKAPDGTEIPLCFLLAGKLGRLYSLRGRANGVKLFSEKTPADPYAAGCVLLRRSDKVLPTCWELSTPKSVHFGGPKMDEKGLAGRKWPEPPVRSTEIYRTRPPFVGLRQDKFRSFRERGSPGGHFLKAGGRPSGDLWRLVRRGSFEQTTSHCWGRAIARSEF